MGKIRVKALGDEQLEKQQKQEAKKRQEQKKAEKAAAPVVEEEKTGKTDEVSASTSGGPKEEKIEKKKMARLDSEAKRVKKDASAKQKNKRSKGYQTVATLVEKNKIYPLDEALKLLPKLKRAKFDETVELHINTTEPGISVGVTLPHGTGKETRVVVADDAVIAQVEKGVIDFDVLIAHPQMMPKLARVAKVLGPRGLMPNPKNGTVTPNPEEAMKKYAGGHKTFKTEAKIPVMHMAVGKVSFGDQKLKENITEAISAVSTAKIKNVTLKSTMSPAIKISFA